VECLPQTLSDGIREFRIKQKLQEHVQMKERGDRLLLSRLEFIEIFKVGWSARCYVTSRR